MQQLRACQAGEGPQIPPPPTPPHPHHFSSLSSANLSSPWTSIVPDLAASASSSEEIHGPGDYISSCLARTCPNTLASTAQAVDTCGSEPYLELQVTLGTYGTEHTPERRPEQMPSRMPAFKCQKDCQTTCQNICQIECQKECLMSAEKSEYTTDRMPETISDRTSQYLQQRLPSRM